MLSVPLYKQSHNFCGPASVRMVLAYFGVKKSENAVAKLVNASRKNGVQPQDIVKGVHKLGFEALYKKNSSTVEIKKYLKKKIPVIVDWFSPETNGHYSVVLGFDKAQICIADPFIKRVRKMEVNQFLHRWFELDQYPPKNKAHFALREIIVIYPSEN